MNNQPPEQVYEILAKRVPERKPEQYVVLCYQSRSVQCFITWIKMMREDHSHYYVQGHYFNNSLEGLKGAIEDYENRE